MTVEAPPPLGNCRVCGNPSWLADDEGPVHLCCARVAPGERCVACAASQGLNRGAGKRVREMAEIRARQKGAGEEEGT